MDAMHRGIRHLWHWRRKRRRMQHVVPHQGEWAVKQEGRRPASLHQRKQDAVDAARQRARRRRTSLVIHGRNGKIQEIHNYQ